MKLEKSIKNLNNTPLDIPGEKDEILLLKLIKAKTLTRELFNLSATLDVFEADNLRGKALENMSAAEVAAGKAAMPWNLRQVAKYREIYLAWKEFYNSIPE